MTYFRIMGYGGGLSEEAVPNFLIVKYKDYCLFLASTGISLNEQGVQSLCPWQGFYPALSTIPPKLMASPSWRPLELIPRVSRTGWSESPFTPIPIRLDNPWSNPSAPLPALLDTASAKSPSANAGCWVRQHRAVYLGSQVGHPVQVPAPALLPQSWATYSTCCVLSSPPVK